MCAGIHEAEHGDIVGVEAQTYILDVGDEDIESLHRLFGWTATFAVIERENRYACLLINTARYMFAFTCCAAETMFRREDGGNIHTMLEQ